jgi:hypothetical protein
MATFGVLGTRLWVGQVALTDVVNAADQLSDFTSLSAGVEVSFIESLGNFGKVFQLVTFQAVADGRMFKYKGGFDPGSFQVTVGMDLTDPGQALLQSYGDSLNQNTYPFKMLFNGADPTVQAVFFGGKVLSFAPQTGSVNNVVKAAINVAVNTSIYYGPDNGG